MKKDESSHSRSLLLGLLLLLLAGAVFSVADHPPQKLNDITRSAQTQQRVNQVMQDSIRHQTLNEQSAQVEKERRWLEAKGSRPQRPLDFHANQLEISEYQERHAFNEDVGRGQKVPGWPADPNQLVQKEIFEDQNQSHATEAYKKEYARQFVENARARGWEIQLDDSFRVTSVKQIERRPTYDVFESKGGGSH